MHILLQLLITTFIVLNSCYYVKAGVTSAFTRTEWPSVDIPLDNEVFAVPKGYNAPQQVSITQGDYDGKGVIISWVTMSEPGPAYVQYGTSKHYDHKAEAKFTNYTFFDYTSGFLHHAFVGNLQYNTEYYYQVGKGNSARSFTFKTPPEISPDSPYSFGIIGDLGQTYNSLSTLEHYMQTGGQAVLFLGDLSYADRYTSENGKRWDAWGRLIERIAAYQPWIWCAGNHEIEYMPDVGEIIPFKSYLHRYHTPYMWSNSSSPLWYAIRRASAHIIVLSSYSSFVTYSPQWQWLHEELKKVDREKTPWLIVLMHLPMYNSNNAHYMEGESMRVVFESWFVQYKVDFVLAGHVHAYERSYRISNIHYNITNNDCSPIPNKAAPVYITVGDGGNQEGLVGRFVNPQPSYSAFREASYGHSVLQIMNRTHAMYKWIRNDDGKQLAADSVLFLNQYWASNLQRRKLRKQHRSAQVAFDM